MKLLILFITSNLLQLNNVCWAEVPDVLKMENIVFEKSMVGKSGSESVVELIQELGHIWKKLEDKGMRLRCNGTFQLFDPKVPHLPTTTEDPIDCSKLTGPEMVRYIRDGTKVVRGANWQWGNQDGGPGSEGVIVSTTARNRGYVQVRWKNGAENFYRMGALGQYDLKILNYCT